MKQRVLPFTKPSDLRAVSPWQSALAGLAVASAVLLGIFHKDVGDIFAIWWNSSTFNHCLLILPILIWLVGQRKEQLELLTPQACAPGLLYVVAGALTWLIGDAAGLAVARQLGLILMLQGSVLTLLGPGVARGLLFPLFYMFFLLPVGEEAVPALQTPTADMCMLLLGWVGVPAHLDGIFITTPGGYFRVAESCSGVKFLVAMVAYGVLVANLCFESWIRRAAFLLACVAVPILANGVRAFATIYISQYQGVAFAEGMDHVIYGWVFFGIVIGLIMAIGWPFFDRRADADAFDPAKLKSKVRWQIAMPSALAALLLTASLPVAWSAFVAGRESPVPTRIMLPQVEGWMRVSSGSVIKWAPRFDGASHYLAGRYQNASGSKVDLVIVTFDKQSEDRELIGFGQGAVDPDGIWSWSADLRAPSSAKAERIKTKGATRDVVTFYRVNGVTTGSAAAVKFATLKARLMNGNQQAVAILISAEHSDAHPARPHIDDFIQSLGDIDKMADRFAGLG